jgi:hypothetical protein
MNHELNQAADKKPYERPRLVTISLRPEEAVLGHCKISGATGAGGGCQVIGLCPTQGS